FPGVGPGGAGGRGRRTEIGQAGTTTRKPPRVDELPGAHVSSEDIAGLGEGTLPPENAEIVLAHLSRCRSCMAAYVEAVRYRAAWLAKPKAFKPPDDVLGRGRAGVPPGPAVRPTPPRRPLPAGSSRAAASLGGVLVLRSGGTPWGAREPLPQPVAQAIAERTHLSSGLFVPGAEAVRTQPTDVFRGGTEDPDAIVPPRALDSLRAMYEHAKNPRSRGRAGYQLASALLARGSVDGARDVVDELLAAQPGDCACPALAAQLDYARSPGRAERHLREAVTAGCRGGATRRDLATGALAPGASAGAGETLEQLEPRDDALGDRARRELGHDKPR